MPIAEAYKAKTPIVGRRTMAAGGAGRDSEPFCTDQAGTGAGDATQLAQDRVEAVG
jgi:NAD/NADP transhydrogenase beta subunit